jgi:hypothetical protein
MPRGPAPPWRARKPPILDDHVLASIDGANGKYDEDTGFYKTLRMRADPGEDIAELHRALRRSAVYLHSNEIADIGIHVAKKRDRKGPYLEYVAVNKAHTYKYMIAKYGEDRSLWPYDVHRRQIGDN